MNLSRNSYGRLVFMDDIGIAHVGVVPVRAHPISAPDEGVSIIGQDGHELAWIARLSELASPARELIEAELASRDFSPVIQRICSVSTFATPSLWSVETDRGPTEFILKTEEDIRRLGDGRLLIASSHGIGFAVPDRFALDKASKRLLERFLF
jgi:hypothetical protein